MVRCPIERHPEVFVEGFDVAREGADTDLFQITGHTISQRLRTLRKIPPELVPLGTSI